MPRLLALALLSLTAACATDEAPPPSVLAAQADPCAAVQTGSFMDPQGGELLGCANAANLRLMVADPSHLERGEETTNASDELAIGAAQRLRLGKTPRPRGEATSGAADLTANSGENK